MAELLFYVLSIVTVVGAISVVVAKSPMMSVIALLVAFFSLAVIYLLAGFQFMAAIQVMVYVGAIMVLFLYVIMLLNLSEIGQAAEADLGFFRGRQASLGAVLAGAITLVALFAVQRGAVRAPDPLAVEHGLDSIEAIALALFGRYFLPFEAAGILLLVTMVAVIALAKRQRGPVRTDAPKAPSATGAPDPTR